MRRPTSRLRPLGLAGLVSLWSAWPGPLTTATGQDEPAPSPPAQEDAAPAEATDPAAPPSGTVGEDAPPAAAPADPPAEGDAPPQAPGESPGAPDAGEPGTDDEVEEEPSPAPDPADADNGYEQIAILARAIETIRQNYVDPDKISYEDLLAAALEGMLSSLDPHCQYMHPTVFAQMKREQTNTYDGVGITIARDSDALTIVSVREDGPAAAAGVLAGDTIVGIDGQLTDEIGLGEAIQLLKGRPGEPIRMVVRRPATGELLEVEMVRQVIQLDTVKDAMLLHSRLAGDAKIGYVRLLQFNEPTADELAEALDRLEDDGMEALVLDLRNNPGGLLNVAIDVIGEFVPPDTLVLTTEGRDPAKDPPPYRTPERKRRPREYPMAILVNHGSASASEVVSGALQDLRRSVIVGETTFGKGSVQSVIPMDRGAAMRLTTAKYYTPSHRTIHENGIVPNIVATLTPEEEGRLMQWFSDRSLNNVKARELAEIGDRQLERAVDVLKGVMAYRSR